MSRALLWLHRDLRLADNPALLAAAAHEQMAVIYVVDSEAAAGAASRAWLHRALHVLDNELRARGSALHVLEGDPLQLIDSLLRQYQFTHVCFNRSHDAHWCLTQQQLVRIAQQLDVTIETGDAYLLHEPGTALTAEGKPYRVYTPFWKHVARQPVAMPVPDPGKLPSLPQEWKACIKAADGLLPAIRWDEPLMASWKVGEQAAWERLESQLENMSGYAEGRDYPSQDKTSGLSAYLHFGHITPRQIWQRLWQHEQSHPRQGQDLEVFRKELVWREFAYHLMHFFPHTVEQPYNPRFAHFPWRSPDDYRQDLLMWQQGRTGVALVDAGMRELWQTGFMQNRVRMVVASFLTKNLLIPWQEGERWFFDTLVDADRAVNVMNWQWVAGCGVDSAPYFRIFNPESQMEKFDAQGSYVRRWVPEYGTWRYAKAMVDLKATRARALAVYQSLGER